MIKTTPQFNQAYKQSNPQQKQAINTIEGPVMVIAGPGTGKTQTLALRIANILQKTDTPPYAILAMTFTEAGATEMRQRLINLIGPDGYYVVIGTFHSFGTAVIREHPDKFQFTEDSEPLTELERIQIITEILDNNTFQILKPLGKPHLFVKAIIQNLQTLKREGYTPQKFSNFLSRYFEPISKTIKKQKTNSDLPKLLELQKIFSLYQKQLEKQNRYDFEDMINKVTQTFKQNPDLLLEYQEKFHYFLVDEYQDTNSSQNQLLFQLTSYWGDQANIFVVGDPDQSIYRFQGASLENILTFQKKYPQAKIIQLQNNYRSQQTILNAAHSLIQKSTNNDLKINSKQNHPLTSQTNLTSYPIEIATFPSSTIEYSYIAHQIKKLIKAGTPANQIAILYRNNSDANEIADILGKMKIKYNLEGGDNILHTPEIIKLITLMRTIVNLRNKSEDLDLFTFLNYEFNNIDPLDTLKLSRFASQNRINLLEAILHPNIKNINLSNLHKIKQILNQLTTFSQFDTEAPFVKTFEKIINDSGFLQSILNQPNSIRKLNQINSLFRQIKQFNSTDHRFNLQKFLKAIKLMENNYLKIPEEDLDIDIDAIRLSTAHKAKGLEFEHIFIINAYDTKWGNKRTPQLIKLPIKIISNHPEIITESQNSTNNHTAKTNKKQQQNEDERRLFYVAITRAKKHCTITYSTKYKNKQTVPTMFITEISNQYKQTIDTSKFQNQTKKILKNLFIPTNPIEITPAEQDWLHQILINFKLNPTALNTYLQCSYKFKLDTLLRTPRAKPEPMAYGTAIHSALEKFFKKYRETNKIPSTNYLLTLFNHALKKEILTPQQLIEWQNRGEKALRIYLTYYINEIQPPLMTEKFFGGKFNPIYIDDIPLSGKIDKVEIINQNKKTKNLKPKTVRIIDYKTGRPKSRNEILGNTKNSDGGYHRQLIFYQLLTELDQTFKYQTIETQLDFIETNNSGKLKRETFIINKEQVKELKILIKQTMQKIRNLEFPKTKDRSICQKCDYLHHCWEKGIPTTSLDSTSLPA